VSGTINLADPAFEPSDEDLVGLSVRAFAHVRAENDERLRKLREDIAVRREAVLRRLRERWGVGPAER
jgi:hypothetical protein